MRSGGRIGVLKLVDAVAMRAYSWHRLRAGSISHFLCDVQSNLIKNADKSTFSDFFVSAQGLGRAGGLKSRKNRNLYTFAYVIRALLQNGIIHTIHFIILRALPHLIFNSKNS